MPLRHEGRFRGHPVVTLVVFFRGRPPSEARMALDPPPPAHELRTLFLTECITHFGWDPSKSRARARLAQKHRAKTSILTTICECITDSVADLSRMRAWASMHSQNSNGSIDFYKSFEMHHKFCSRPLQNASVGIGSVTKLKQEHRL